ncbi:MarR family winged helix-turn-helix transcriptional regulator [Tsukamurella soli]|uniref:HTH marR-type domain-containing protein n=1 Tax=Tsukamurella soli TaxID=644556 RepID=A0ABP8JPH9_9ACTN
MQAIPHDEPATAARCLTEVLAEFVGRLMCGSTQQMLGAVLASEITVQQFHVLVVLSSADHPVAINRLADQLGLSVAATGRNVERLVQMGLVDRREDVRDRRIKNLTVTDDGRSSLAAAIADKHRDVQSLASQLPADLCTRLHDVLSEILGLGILPENPLFTATKVTS